MLSCSGLIWVVWQWFSGAMGCTVLPAFDPPYPESSQEANTSCGLTRNLGDSGWEGRAKGQSRDTEQSHRPPWAGSRGRSLLWPLSSGYPFLWDWSGSVWTVSTLNTVTWIIVRHQENKTFLKVNCSLYHSLKLTFTVMCHGGLYIPKMSSEFWTGAIKLINMWSSRSIN